MTRYRAACHPSALTVGKVCLLYPCSGLQTMGSHHAALLEVVPGSSPSSTRHFETRHLYAEALRQIRKSRYAKPDTNRTFRRCNCKPVLVVTNCSVYKKGRNQSFLTSVGFQPTNIGLLRRLLRHGSSSRRACCRRVIDESLLLGFAAGCSRVGVSRSPPGSIVAPESGG